MPQFKPNEPSRSKQVHESEFPFTGSSEEKFRFLLRYAILAPSNRNTQPWVWRVNGDSIELHADRTRALPHLDPEDRELILSCGAALLHLRLAMEHFGLKDEVTLLPDDDNPNLLAVVRLVEGSTVTSDEEQLFTAIPKRHTNRHPFVERDLPVQMKEDLRTEAEREGVHLFVIDDNQTRWVKWSLTRWR